MPIHFNEPISFLQVRPIHSFIIIILLFDHASDLTTLIYIYRVWISGSQIAMHFLKYAMQKSTKTNKITMQVLHMYFSHMLHVCYAYSLHMLRILLVTYIVRFFVYVVRILCTYSSHMLHIILAYDMRIPRICYASSLCMVYIRILHTCCAYDICIICIC